MSDNQSGPLGSRQNDPRMHPNGWGSDRASSDTPRRPAAEGHSLGRGERRTSGN